MGESQEEFGKRFGISHAAVSDLERGITDHIPTKIFELIFYGEIKKACPSCHGDGYIKVKPQIEAL